MGQALGCIKVQAPNVTVTEDLGNFEKVKNPGCHTACWWFGKMKAGDISLGLQTKEVRVQTTTKDHVSVTLVVRVSYEVVAINADKAFYHQKEIRSKIESHSYDIIRAYVPTLDLESVFSQKKEIDKSLDDEIKSATLDLGFKIVSVLIIDIEIDESLKRAIDSDYLFELRKNTLGEGSTSY